jgi:hypothetical protein
LIDRAYTPARLVAADCRRATPEVDRRMLISVLRRYFWRDHWNGDWRGATRATRVMSWFLGREAAGLECSAFYDGVAFVWWTLWKKK